MKTVTLGKAQPPFKYQLNHDVSILQQLLDACRVAPTDPGGADIATLGRPVRTQADLIQHMEALQRHLATWPEALHVHPPRDSRSKASYCDSYIA